MIARDGSLVEIAPGGETIRHSGTPRFEDLPYQERRTILARSRGRHVAFHASKDWLPCDCCGEPTRARRMDYAEPMGALVGLTNALNGTHVPVAMVEVARHMLCDISRW